MTIVRDDWGIAHVSGRDRRAMRCSARSTRRPRTISPRIEANYLTALGRTAEAEGEARDLAGPAPAALCRSGRAAGASIATSPPWLRRLMDAWADGLNFYLATHPAVHPRC